MSFRTSSPFTVRGVRDAAAQDAVSGKVSSAAATLISRTTGAYPHEMVALAVQFLIVASIIIFGFLGEEVFRRTGVPSFLWLIGIGVLLGPVLGIFPRGALLPVLGVFAELTLLIVLFYGGMDIKLSGLIGGGGRAFLQVVLYVIPSVIAIAVVVSLLLHWSPLQSLIFSSIVGGETTVAAMVPLSRSLKLPDQVAAFVTLESAMNSVFSVILFFTFVAAYTAQAASPATVVTSIAANFSIGIVEGALLGLAWISLLHRWRSQKYTYVLTVGLILLTYGLISESGGSGELGVLVFGIVLGNYQAVGRLFGRKLNMDALQSQLNLFHGEISFLLGTLFFVFLGLTFEVEASSVTGNLLVGLVILAVLLLLRRSAITLSTAGSEMRPYAQLLTFLCAMGLTPATLAVIAVNLNLPLAASYLTLVTYVVIFTNVVTAAGSIWRMRTRRPESLPSPQVTDA